MTSKAQQSFGLLSNSESSILRDWVLITAFGSFFYGIYATHSLGTMYIFITKNTHKSKIRAAACVALNISMLLISTSALFLDLKLILIKASASGFSGLSSSSQIFFPSSSAKTMGIALEFLRRGNYPISDLIVVSRAWHMFPYNHIVKILLTICMIGSCAGTLMDASITVKHFDDKDSDSEGRSILWTMATPLFITNLFATSLIGYKAWVHHHNIRRNLSGNSFVSKASKILVLLVESGFIYCILWITYTVISLSHGIDTISGIFSATMPHISGLYPVFIMLIVACQEHSTSINSEDVNTASLSQSIIFAARSIPDELRWEVVDKAIH